MRAVFRVDASLEIGSGHVMRCATLADMLEARGAETLFVCRDLPGNYCRWLESRGKAVLRLRAPTAGDVAASGAGAPHQRWLGVSVEQETVEAAAAFESEGPFDWLVVDHYALDGEWEHAMRPYCRRILVIDDLADRQHDCEVLLDQNVVADADVRYNGKVPPQCRLLIGPHFALLHAAYSEWHLRTLPRMDAARSRLLIFFGGVDRENLTGRALKALHKLRGGGFTTDVVVGGGNPYALELATLATTIPGVTLHASLPCLAPLMADADLALGGCGTTAWERCCLGVPAIVVSLAENQRPVAAEMHRLGLVEWLGDAAAVDEWRIEQALTTSFSAAARRRCSRACWRLVDGKGAERVRDQLLAGLSI